MLTWRRLLAVTLAKSLLVGLLGLAAWGALPALIGWHPTTVSSGSMMPRLHVGDIAVSRPLGSQPPPLTSVLLFDDPDHPGRLRMHRLVRIDDDGLLVTRGDANNADDSTPVALGAVRGIGTLRVPWVALPIVWLREGRWLSLLLVAAGLTVLLVVAAAGRDVAFADEEPTDPDDDAGPEPPGGAFPGGAVAVPGAVPPGAGKTSGAVLRRGAALAGAALLTVSLTATADARFTDTTTARASLGAATTAFTCSSVVAGLRPVLWYRMDETSSTTTTATDSSGNGRTGVYGSAGKTTTTSKACARDTGRAMTFNGSGYLSSPAVPGGSPNTFSLAVWFRTTTTTGGKLIGFGSAQTGQSANYDRHLYLGDAGRLYFGVYSGGNRTLASSAAYNDGAWHLGVATMSTAGMRLYVDGRLVGSDPGTTVGEPGSTSYVRVASDNLTFWLDQPTSSAFTGTLDDAAYFPTALTSTDVQTLFDAHLA